jgi:hypothetical protein
MLPDSEVLWAGDIESGFWLLKYYYFAFHFILWLLERFFLMRSKYVQFGYQRWAPALFSRFRSREREGKKERESAKKKKREKS